MARKPRQSKPREPSFRNKWLKGWTLFIEIAGLISLLVGLYALTPGFSLSPLLPSDLHGLNGAKLSLTNTGTKIRNVRVQCFTNKVIFEDTYTLALRRFVLIDEYAVPDVERGESFTADCNFGWSLWMKPIEGYFLLGNGVPGAKQLGIPFVLKDGLPALRPGAPIASMIQPYLTGYNYYQITALDGSFVISYSWPFSWFHHQTVIHMIARRTADGLKWRVAPKSEPTIADAPNPNGFIVTATSNTKEWGVVLNRASPH